MLNLRSSAWRPVAIVIGVINVAGIGFAAAAGEPLHAAAHVALAALTGLWVSRIGTAPSVSDAARLDDLEAVVVDLRSELAELEERLDFAERLLAREPGQVRPLGPER